MKQFQACACFCHTHNGPAHLDGSKCCGTISAKQSQWEEELDGVYNHTMTEVEASNRINKKLVESHSQLLERLKERIQKEPEWYEAFDSSGHRYQIPKNKAGEWLKWRGIPEDDERAWVAPDFAERIDGKAIKPVKDSILSIISEMQKEMEGETNA